MIERDDKNDKRYDANQPGLNIRDKIVVASGHTTTAQLDPVEVLLSRNDSVGERLALTPALSPRLCLAHIFYTA